MFAVGCRSVISGSAGWPGLGAWGGEVGGRSVWVVGGEWGLVRVFLGRGGSRGNCGGPPPAPGARTSRAAGDGHRRGPGPARLHAAGRVHGAVAPARVAVGI